MRTNISKCILVGLTLGGLLLCGSARAAITLQDGGTNVIRTSANSITAPGFTVTAGASVLVVNVFTRDNQTADALPATLPWGAQTLTKIASVNNGNATWAWSEIYYLYNPAAMTQDITISEAPSSGAMTMQVFTLAGVDTSFAPVPYTAQNNNGQTLSVTLTGTPAGSWASVSSSYGTGNLLMTVTASSGTVNCVPVQNVTSQDMGYVSNIVNSTSTITATDNAGNQKLSLAVAVFFPAGALPGAPNLSGAASGSQVTLTWSAVGNANSYNVLRSTTSGGETLLVSGLTGTTYTDTTTAIGTTYYYEVQAVNGNGPSGNSAEVSVTPLPAPTGLAATGQTNRVALSWSSTSGATGYRVQRSITSGGPYSTIATGVASTSYIDHTVYDGTAYYYVVEALNSTATSAASAQAGPATPFFALPPGAATGVLLKDGGTNSITTTGNGVSTISSSFAVSSGAHVLVVELWDNDTANNGSSPSTMIWVVGTTTNILTRAVSQSSTAADCDIYYVFNPTSGAGTISATDNTGSVQGMSMMPFTLRGVDTTVAPVIYQNTSASATTVSVNLASVTPATAWAAVLSSDSSTGQALTQTSTGGTSIYKSVNNNACLGYVQNVAGGATIAMHGASGAVSLAVAVFMPAVATPIAILDGSIAAVADGGNSGTVTMPFSVSEGATVLTAALGQINNANPFTTNILWANTSLGVTQNVFAVGSQWAGYGQIHPNVHALLDPLPGNGFLIATLPGNGATHLFLQAYTLVGVDTAIPTAVYGAGTESTLPAGVRTNYIAVNLAPSTPANSWAEVCTYDNAGNLSALMTIGATNNGAAVGTVVTTNFNPSILCTAGYVSNLPNSACTISALHGVSGAADALGINVAVFSPLVLQTVPLAPINLVATPHTGSVSLTWADNSNATSYNLYRATNSGGPYVLLTTTVGGTATNFTDTYVVGGLTYYYVVAGVNIAGQSPNSAEASATPSSGPVIGAGIGLVDGSINNSITVGAVQNFSMPFSVSYGASVLVAATYDNNGNNNAEKGPALVWSNTTFGTTQPLTAAVVGTPGADNQTWGTLYYLMAPVPGVGQIIATETAAGQAATYLQAYTLGGVDTNVPPTTAESGNIGASTLSVDTDPGTLSFSWAAVLAADYDGGGGNDVFITSTSGSVITVNTRPNGLQFRAGYISNLDAGDTTITATKTGTTGTSMYLATEVFSPLITMPAPASVTATGQTNQIKVTWATVSGATSYVLLRSTTSGHGYTAIATNVGNGSTTYTDTTVTDWVPYYYVVQAYGPNGVSIYSPEATAYAVGTPSAAKGLTAFGDINRVDLSWNSELGADSYTVLRSTTSGSEATLVSGLTDTNYTDSSVVDGTRYYYKVRVVNNIFGTGPNSAEVSAIPVVTFFTNTFGLFIYPGGTIGTWTVINGSPNINLAENTVLGAPDYPSYGLSTDCLIVETNMGPNTIADLQGMGNAFSPSINVRTYTALELDIKNFGAYDRNNQIQAIQLSLQVPVGGVPTYERGTWGDIVLSATGTGGSWTHYSAPMTNWAAFDLTQVTSVGINVFDSLYLASSDMAVGFANMEFSGAPGWQSTIAAVSRSSASGSTSVTLTGKVTGLVDSTNLPLALNTPITVTINGSTQTTAINDATGDFSINFNTTGFANGVYPVTYTSASDMVALLGATNTSTSLTLTAPPARPTILAPSVDATHTNLVVRVTTVSGWNYYLLSTPSLTPPVVWTTNSITVGTGGTITNLVPISSNPPELFLRYMIR